MAMVWAKALRGRIWAPAAVATLLGAAIGLYLPVWLPGAVVAALLCAGLALRGLRRPASPWPAMAAWWLLLLAALMRAASVAEPPEPPPLDLPLPRLAPPVLRLRVVTEPEFSPGGHRFVARWLARCAPTTHGLRCEPRHGLLRVDVAGRQVAVHAGDLLRVPAFTAPPPHYANPGAYDLRPAFQRAGLVAAVRVGHAERLWLEPEPPRWGLGALVDGVRREVGSLRRTLSGGLTRAVPGRDGAILAALALGDKGSSDPELQSWLQATGTAHVMAVSGSHLALVVWLVRLVLRWSLARLATGWLRRWPLEQLLAPPCILVAWGYALLTGSPASSLRAAWMASVLLLGRASGRAPDLGESLGFAALALLVYDPAAVADVGLVLSVAGVLGLAWAGTQAPLAPPRAWGARLRAALRGLWHACLAPFAATAPVTAVAFSSLALASPLANFVVVPYAGMLLPVALAATITCALPLSDQALALVAPAAHAALAPLRWLLEVPAVSWPVWRGAGWTAVTVGCAVPLALAAWWQRGHWRPLAALVALAAVATWLGAQPAARDVWGDSSQVSVRVAFLDVGHGDATLLQFGDGSTMLVDAGGELGDDGRVGALAVLPFLQQAGVTRIDRMVLTHAHPDHENGLLAVARAMPVGEFWWNGQRPGGQEHPALLGALARHGTRWRDFSQATAQRQFTIGGADVAVLWPTSALAPYSPDLHHNDNSLVLEVRVAGRSLLLSGDIERAAEAALTQAGTLRPVDVLKVPHHGSATSSTPPLLAALRPKLAVAGARSWGQLPFPHPDIVARYAAAGIPLWSTGEGWVELELSAQGIWARQAGKAWSFNAPPRRWTSAPNRAAAARAPPPPPAPAATPGR